MRLILTLISFFFLIVGYSQETEVRKIYSITSGELIFAWNDAVFTESFMQANPESKLENNNMRFSCFFHLAQYWHYDFTHSLGMFTGMGVRNIGMSTDEVHFSNEENKLLDYKFIRRNYMLGIPFALKLGSFNDNLYVFGGAEYEISLHYKQKYWQSHSRSGGKTIDKKWFGNQSPAFLPSVFVGVQLPKGIHVTLKHYFNDFLNTSYISTNLVEDFSRYQQSKITYLSISWQVRSDRIRKSVGKKDGTVYTRL